MTINTGGTRFGPRTGRSATDCCRPQIIVLTTSHGEKRCANKMKTFSYFAATVALTLAFPAQAQRAFDNNILADTFGFDENTEHVIPFDELHQGCADRDCFNSIDSPNFVPAADADHVGDEDVVIAISWQGEFRAYPARILDHHEIVNDTIAGTPIAITWCPLCGSAVGIHREFGGRVTEFGVSGLLYESNQVLYDRATESLWDQIGMTAIVGPMTGEKLRLVPVTMTRWSRWRKRHPETVVLSTDTGFEEDYSKDRYTSYRNSTRLMFPVSQEDERLHPKTVVYGFQLEAGTVAFSESLLIEQGTSRYQVLGDEFVVDYHDDGSVVLTEGNGDTHSPIRLFWFAWYTFYPETKLVR